MLAPVTRGRPGGRRAMMALLAAAWCAVSLAAPLPPAAAAALTAATWTASATTTGATGVTYTFTFTTASAAPLSSVTMSVPSGTGGSPAVGSVSPASIAGGSASLAGTTLTYSFTAAQVSAGTTVSVQVTGLTNSATAGAYTSSLTTLDGAGAVDTGTAGTVTLTAGALTSLGWSASSTVLGATGASYTYTFTTATAAVITSFTMTVPPGTGGTPALGTTSPLMLLGSVSLTGTTLTVSGVSLSLTAGQHVSIQVTGLTNTATAGRYTSEIATHASLTPNVDSGNTPAVSFTGLLTLTSPGSLTWAATLNGTGQSVADQVAAHQQLGVDDETATGSGWHITVAATTFSTGTYALPDTGTLSFTGSLTSASATSAPTAACVSGCTPPVSTASYPVAITTAASSPAPATVYAAAAGSGLGPATLGGSGAASPAGWWVTIPARARTGAYASTVTVAVVSGP